MIDSSNLPLQQCDDMVCSMLAVCRIVIIHWRLLFQLPGSWSTKWLAWQTAGKTVARFSRGMRESSSLVRRIADPLPTKQGNGYRKDAAWRQLVKSCAHFEKKRVLSSGNQVVCSQVWSFPCPSVSPSWRSTSQCLPVALTPQMAQFLDNFGANGLFPKSYLHLPCVSARVIDVFLFDFCFLLWVLSELEFFLKFSQWMQT